MFRFIYAAEADESPAAAWMTDGFIGIEADTAREGVGWIGAYGDQVSGSNSLTYMILPVQAGRSAAEIGKQLHGDAERRPSVLVFVENGGAFVTAHDLWTLLEAAHHSRVKLALDLDVARMSGQSAAVLVPTLNLRIGLIRVRQAGNDVADYARRLAGIGFDGYVVIDPPAGPERINAAQVIADVFREIFYAKSSKKTAVAKAAT